MVAPPETGAPQAAGSSLAMEPYPRFSDAEFDRRRRAVLEAMAEEGVRHAVVYGSNRFGPAVTWLTGWPVTREAALLLSEEEPDLLLVQFHNHVPCARELARCEARWAGPSTTETVVEELARRGARGPVGTLGPVTVELQAALGAGFERVVPLDRRYTELRLVKSAEELAWARVGAELSDRAVEAILRDGRPGMSERELADLVERSYVPAGGTTYIHYFGVTSMARPDRCVPAQFASTRRLEPGDVLVTEISAAFWDYPGQVLRTFTVAAEPTPLYRDLHQVAQAAFEAIVAAIREGAHPQELVEAAAVIEEAGFTTYDDLVHGFVGGYLPPVVGSRSRTLWPVPDLPLRAGMCLVVQPNVITRDERAGVQTGELVVVTAQGAERLHRAPPGLLRIGR